MVTRKPCHAQSLLGESYPLQSHPLQHADDDVDSSLEEGEVCRICWGEREDSEGVLL